MKKDQKTYFNERSVGYDDRPDRIAWAEQLADAFLESVTFSKEDVVLDLGAGTGLLTVHVAPHVKHIEAVDTSDGMLKGLNEKILRLGINNISTLLAEHTDPQLELIKPDIIISSLTLHHIEDVADAFEKFYTILNLGGRIAIADLETEPEDFHADSSGVIHFGFEAQYLADCAQNAGFEDVTSEAFFSVCKKVNEQDREFPVLLIVGKKPD